MEGECACIHCGAKAKELYRRYSATVLKLAQCEYCGNVVDKYVEHDVVLVLLDLLLQKIEAYRHVLFNSGLQSYWRLGLIFIICDAYYKWMIRRSHTERPDSAENESKDFYDLEWSFYVCLLQSVIETCVFLLTALTTLKLGVQNKERIDFGFLSKALLAGFYGNVLVVGAIIWRLHLHFSYVVLTRAFIFVSQLKALQAAADASFGMSLIAVTAAMVTQWSIGLFFNDILWNYITGM